MDDLYDGWEDPLGPELTHLLQKKFLPALRQGAPFQLPHYNWHRRQWYMSDPYPFSTFTILEGVGAGQRSLRSSVSLALWIEVPSEIAQARVLRRDGEAIADEMERFRRLEQEHFIREESRSAADYRLMGM
jgi:uridine kinase